MDTQVKKKVVFIINNLVVGGVERFLRQVLLRFGEGYEVSVITVWGSGVLAKQYEVSNIPVHFTAGRTLYSSKNPLLKLYFSIIAPITFIRLIALLNREKPDIVMTCLTQADILGILGSFLAGVPRRIVRQADVKPLSPVVKKVKQFIINNFATKIIANSQNTKEFTVNYFGFPKNKVVVVQNGINVKQFLSTNFPRINTQNPVIGFLGRLEKIKGADTFIDAICLINKEKIIQNQIKVFGEGSLRDNMVSKVQECQMQNVVFEGEVLDPKEALQKLDILVIPSISEGFGFIVLEGLFSGRVVVASDIPTFREVIQNKKNGVLIRPQDKKALAAAIVEVVKRPNYMNSIAKEVKNWVTENAEKYDIDNVAKRYKFEILGS